MYNQLRNDVSLCNLAKRCAGDKWEDVIQEIGIVICSKDDTELIKLNNYFNFWCARTIINMSSSKGVVGRNKILIDENADVSEYTGESDVDIEEIHTKATKILEQIHWYDRDLFKVYLETGSFRKTSKETKIPLTSVHATVRGVKEELIRKLK